MSDTDHTTDTGVDTGTEHDAGTTTGDDGDPTAPDSQIDRSATKGDESTARSVRRRSVLAGLAGLGVLGTATGTARAASTPLEFGGDYTGDPGADYGLRLDPSNARFGFLGFSSASNGRGVVGRATSSTGETIGVIGRSDSSSDGAAGLMGFNDASSGRTYGFKGRSDSTEGRGALGIATADSGNTIGLEGRADSPSGVAVSGTSTAPSGVTVGVLGRVASPYGFGLYTPDNARIEGFLHVVELGTIDVTPLEFVSGGNRVLRLSPESAGSAGNVIAGHSSNSAVAGTVGGTIGGGGFDDGTTILPNRVEGGYPTVGGGRNNEAAGFGATVSGGMDNTVAAAFATIGGGEGNATNGQWTSIGGGFDNVSDGSYGTIGGGESNLVWAVSDRCTIGGGAGNEVWGDSSTIGGGQDNTINGDWVTVGGGLNNTANGPLATVPGGGANEANGDFAFAAGRRAKATDPGSFVWADRQGFDFPSNGENSWSARTTGGARFVTAIDGSGNPTAGTVLAAGSGTWSALSARAAKTDVRPVDPDAVLEGVRDLSINTWRYTAESGVDHVGPMAEDFHDTFGLGPDDEHITTVDADGVLFAAVQALAERCDEAKRELDEKDDRIDDLEERVEHRDDRITALGAENDALRDRLAAIDDRVASLESGHAHPATGDD